MAVDDDIVTKKSILWTVLQQCLNLYKTYNCGIWTYVEWSRTSNLGELKFVQILYKSKIHSFFLYVRNIWFNQSFYINNEVWC